MMFVPAKSSVRGRRGINRFFLLLGAGVVSAAIVAGVVCLSGKDIAVVKKWHDNGKPKETWVYRRDVFGREKKVRELVYFESGLKETEVDYRDGKVNGWARIWYKSGQLFLEATYKDNKMHGVRRAYYENGQLFCRAEFEEGQLVRRENWDEEGNEIYLDMDRPPPF
jgi:hypothetical protein